MKFQVTEDNSPYLDARGKIILNACPGSGKTSAIAYKLSLMNKESAKDYGAYSGIACLSFTNVAKEEIQEKFSAITGNQICYPNLISTIDSFINQYITLPFYYLLGLESPRPDIMTTVGFLDEVRLGNFSNKANQPLSRIYKPSELLIEYNGSYSWKGYVPKEESVDLGVFKRYAKTYKEWQFNKGYLNNDDSTYAAFQLLKRYPSIAKSLIQRFPYFIIDEAQDTSEIQYGIFDALVAAGLQHLEFVGDPYQSLYEFRNARPELFLKRFNDSENWISMNFNDCRRSSQYIVNTYSSLRNDGEKKILSISTHESNHKVKVLLYDDTKPNELLNQYYKIVNPDGKNVILVRGKTHLELFGAFSQPDSPWKSELASILIESAGHLKQNKLKSCIDLLRKFLVEIKFPGANYYDKKKRIDEIFADEATNILLYSFLRAMPSLDDTIGAWNKSITKCISEFFEIEIDLQLKKNKGKPYYEQNLMSLYFPDVSSVYPVSTIHKVKGMTFSSILLVLSDGGNNNTLSLSDFFLTNEFLTESQRLLYVALSRPETLCCIAIPDHISISEIVARLGVDFEFA